jgi:hypothetical protein
LPEGGWPPPPPTASLALSSIDEQRQRHLKLHGLLVLKVAVPPFELDGSFSWIVPLPDHLTGCSSITWYCDGSLIDGKWRAIRCSGFGLAAVTSDGDLVAYGLGWPPSWCDTAASAEAWDMLTVLSYCPFVPLIRTDCQALLTTALAGNASATHHDRPLARVWSMVAHIVGDDLSSIVNSGKLVWMPAHKSQKAVGVAQLSNGQLLTTIDWRANRLVDGLAKAAAKSLAAPSQVSAFLRSADAAAAHAACLLGVVTHEANNHRVTAVADGGGSTTTVTRDSSDRPRFDASGSDTRASSLPPQHTPVASRTLDGPAASAAVLPWRPPTPKVQANRLHRAASDSALIRRVEEIGANLAPPLCRPSAAERLGALAARIRDKQASPPGSGATA